jgi:hypothetical protein
MPAGENLLAMWLQVKYGAPVRRFLCPVCGHPLEDTERGLHDVNCGWTESPAPPRFIPRVPDVPQS